MPRRSPKSSKSTKPAPEPTQTITGVIRKADAKTLEIDASDQRIVEFQIDDKTVKPDKLQVGDTVDVEARQDDKGLFTAIDIKKIKSAPKPPQQQQAAAAEPEGNYRATAMKPPPVNDPDDDGPPTLRHGKPQPRKNSAHEDEVAVASEVPPPAGAVPEAPPEADPLLDKAKEASGNFLAGLPSFVCQQFTTRYVSEAHPASWKAQDVVSAEVLYEDGKERYDKVAINGKPAKQKIEETGAWSTGEFGTVLADLFSPATAAQFRRRGERTIERQEAVLYDFTVDRPHSHWTIRVPGQYIMPAYKGSIWISKETARVLRIEMQAVQIPKEFPEDTAEMAMDYDFVNLEIRKFLLPVKAEVLSCIRGSNTCERNVIEFRNYHKYAGESTITFK